MTDLRNDLDLRAHGVSLTLDGQSLVDALRAGSRTQARDITERIVARAHLILDELTDE